MLIGELSRRSGLSRDTIRFYEKKGLIKLGRRDRRVNNYKEYPEAVLERLLLFIKIKSYGFTLNESAGIIALMEANLASCRQISKLAYEKIGILDKKIKDLLDIKKTLENNITGCEGLCDESAEDANCPLFDNP